MSGSCPSRVAVFRPGLPRWVRYVGGFWVVWVSACLPLALLPYGSASELEYDAVQQLVANLGPLVGWYWSPRLGLAARGQHPSRRARYGVSPRVANSWLDRHDGLWNSGSATAPCQARDPDGIDIKPRSRVVTDGLEATASRGMLRAVGMGDEDWEKPQVGVASSLERDHPLQPVPRPAGQGGQGRRARGRRLPAGVRHHLGLRRHLDGPRGDALLAGQPRDHRRLGGDGDVGRAAGRLGAAGRLRQVAARHADGRRPARPGLGLPLRRLDHARPGRRTEDVTIIDAFEAVGACLRA